MGAKDYSVSCAPQFSQLALTGLCCGRHWSWIWINPSPALVSFDLLLCLQRPFNSKLGETMDFFKISASMLLGCFPKLCRGSYIHSHTGWSWPGAPGLGFQGSQQALPPTGHHSCLRPHSSHRFVALGGCAGQWLTLTGVRSVG